MTTADVNADRWSKSVGLCDHCVISSSLFVDCSTDAAVGPKRAEEIASISMAVLGRVKRLVDAGTPWPIRFVFKPHADADEMEVVTETPFPWGNKRLLVLTSAIDGRTAIEIANTHTSQD
jgi:hypothetical protein